MPRLVPEALQAEAVQLVVKQGYSVPQASKVVGVGPTALRRWVNAWRLEHEGPAPPPEAVSASQRRIRELEAEVAALKKDTDTLKKSIAFFIRDNDRRGK